MKGCSSSYYAKSSIGTRAVQSSQQQQQQQESKKSIRFDKVTSAQQQRHHVSNNLNASSASVQHSVATPVTRNTTSSVQHDSVATPRIRNTAATAGRRSSSLSSKRAAFGGVGRWGSNQSCTALSTISSGASSGARQEALDVGEGSIVAADAAATAVVTGPPSLILGPKKSATQQLLSFIASAARKGTSTGSSVAGSWCLRKDDTSRDKITILGLVRQEQPSTRALVSQKLVAVSQRILQNNKTLEAQQQSVSSMPSSSPRQGQNLDRSARGGGEQQQQQQQQRQAAEEQKPEQSQDSCRRGLFPRMISSKDRSLSSEAVMLTSIPTLEAVSQQPNGNAVRIRVSDLRSSSLDRGTTRNSRLRSRSNNSSCRGGGGGGFIYSTTRGRSLRTRSRSLESDAAQANAASLSPIRSTSARPSETSRSKLVGELPSLFSLGKRGSNTDAPSSERGQRLKALAARWQSLSALTTTTTTPRTSSHNNSHARFSLSNMGRNRIRTATCRAGCKDNATTLPSLSMTRPKAISDSEISDNVVGGGGDRSRSHSDRGRDHSLSRSRSRGRSSSRSRGVESAELTSGGELVMSSSASSGRSGRSRSKKRAPKYKSLAASQRSNPTINRMTNRQHDNKKRAKGGAHLADSLYDPAVFALASNVFSCSDCHAANKDKIDTTTYDSKKATKMMRDMANKRAESATNDAICDLIPIPWEHMANASTAATPTAAKRTGGNSVEQNQALLAAQGIVTACTTRAAVGYAVPTGLSPPWECALQQQDKPTTTARQLVIGPFTSEDNHQREEKEGSIGPIQDNSVNRYIYRNTTPEVSVAAIHTQQQQVLNFIGSDLKAAADNVYQGVLSIAACYECVRPEEGMPFPSSYYYPRGGSLLSRNGEEKCSSDGMGCFQPCHTSSSSTAEPLPSLEGGYSV